MYSLLWILCSLKYNSKRQKVHFVTLLKHSSTEDRNMPKVSNLETGVSECVQNQSSGYLTQIFHNTVHALLLIVNN